GGQPEHGHRRVGFLDRLRRPQLRDPIDHQVTRHLVDLHARRRPPRRDQMRVGPGQNAWSVATASVMWRRPSSTSRPRCRGYLTKLVRVVRPTTVPCPSKLRTAYSASSSGSTFL